MRNNPNPKLSTVSLTRKGPEEIAEGTEVEFEIKRVGPNAARIGVKVALTQTGEYLKDGPRTVTVALDPDADTATLTVETIEDDTAEFTGSVTARLIDIPNYNIASPDTATVTVTDEDPYVLVSLAREEAVVEGQALTITLQLFKAKEDPTKINWRTHDSINFTPPATEGVDYNQILPQDITFTSGSLTQTVFVETLDDEVDDAGEMFAIQFGSATTEEGIVPTPVDFAFSDGTFASRSLTSHITITNKGVLPKAYLSGMGREVSRHIADAIVERVQAVERNDPARISPRGDDLLPTFNVTEGVMGLWASASRRDFEVADANGTVDSYTIATDMHRGDWLFGLGVTVSQGEGQYEDMTLESHLTTAHPYMAWIHEQWRAWATLGRGTGTLDMYDTEKDAAYSGIDITHTMLAAGIDREHDEWKSVQVNAGVKGFWSATESDYTRVKSGHVKGARAVNKSITGYIEGIFNRDEALQPSLGLALTYDHDDYTTKTKVRPSIGLRLEHGSLTAHVKAVLIEGQWDTSGNVMFQQNRGFYAELTSTVPRANAIETERADPNLRLETGWKRGGMSPYMAVGPNSWRIGQKREDKAYQLDTYLSNTRNKNQVRIAWRLKW